MVGMVNSNLCIFSLNEKKERKAKEEKERVSELTRKRTALCKD